MTTEPSNPSPEQETTTPPAEETQNESAVATEEKPEGEEEKVEEKINQQVEIKDIGPCKKHIKVTVDRSSIDSCYKNKFSEIAKDAIVPGFRKGKAPRKVIERVYFKEIGPQIKGQLLMASLEQLAEEHDIAPISPPDLNPNKIELPKDGPMVYEFDVEVRPQFDVPDYKGLKIKRPTREFTEEDVAREERRILSQYGQLVPKEGAVERGDYVIADMTTRFHDKVIGNAKELTLRVDERLAFKDGVAEKFAEQIVGAQAGEERVIDIVMGTSVATPTLSGQTVQATLEIKDVKTLRLPELTHEFLHNFDVHSVEEFHELIRGLLDRRLEYQQRQSARQQILQHFETAAKWDLPQDMLVRQARRTMNRRVMEMQESGMSDEEIQGQMRLLQQDIIRSTAMSLKEHFVLQKIAELEKIEVEEDEIETEIDNMAEESGESPRRVRARLEKEQSMETLAALIIERKALDLILSQAEYEDTPLDKIQEQVGVSEEQAVEGEMRDLTAEAEKAEGEGGEQEASQQLSS